MTTTALPLETHDRWTAARARLRRFWPKLGDFLANAVLQKRTYRRLYPGIMHALLFWGVTIQVLGTLVNLTQMALFVPFLVLPWPRGASYFAFELVMDLAGIAILLGVAMGFYRRLVMKPKTLETRWDDLFALTILGLIPLAGYLTEGLRLVSLAPQWAGWSFVGVRVADLLRAAGLTPAGAAALHDYSVVLHIALALALVGSIPFTKMRHLIYAPLNVIFRTRRKAGALEVIENIEETEKLGVGKIDEFASRQLLSFDACVRCGRCEQVCPANFSGMEYSPRVFIQQLRTAMVDTLGKPSGNGNETPELLGQSVPEASIWSCTTCGACQDLCPAFVNPVEEIVDLRRYQALTSGKLPKSVADTLRNMERQGNPWGMPADDRMAWAEGLEVRELAPGESTDVLLFMGCAAAFDQRSRKAARAFVGLLQQAGVDFAVLGYDEMCCGETARRMGHEYIFQEFARQNIEILSKVKFNRLVTQCPHCYNTLKNEYPPLGGSYTVQHATEALAALPLAWNAPQEQPAPQEQAAPSNGNRPTFTFHDSCYLGRYNQVYRQPRVLLEKAGVKLVEMDKHGAESFCCGGGGGAAWQETDASTRINHRRLEQALEAKAGAIATACPYCLLMFDDAIRSKGLGEQVQVLDISEIIAANLKNGSANLNNATR